MQIGNDPAKFIVVALVVCVHLTWIICRKSKEPFHWKNLSTGFGILLLTTCCCLLGALCQGQSPFVPLTPILCGLAISSRQVNVSMRAGATLIGLLTALGFVMLTSAVSRLPQYADGAASMWQEKNVQTFYSVLPRIDSKTPARKYPSGYLDSGQFGPFLGSHPLLHLVRPRTLWHSYLTGILGQGLDTYRLWVPGGTIQECTDGILAIPPGTPKGSEEKMGVRIDKYRDAAYDPSDW